MEKLDVVVIGTGVIGLAIARAFALQGREVIVLEKNSTFGEGISSRNSEVIHAGIYYSTDSLKALCCVRGKEMLYAYCNERQIPHKKIGKLIVACSNPEKKVLKKYIKNAENNGVDDLQLLSAAEAIALEPNISCVGAIFSPSSGILDSHSLMVNFIADIEANGGFVVYNSPLISGESNHNGFTLTIGGHFETNVSCKLLINAGGLNATDIASKLGVQAPAVPKIYLAKGNYFSLTGHSPFNHLVYPLANSAGLGIHATLDMNKQVKFGPDVEWVEKEEYSVCENRKEVFMKEIARYYPDIVKRNLLPAYAGIRPKICGPDEPAADFYIQGVAEHGISNLINLFGIESPGLTACLAIAEHVANLAHIR